jgi:hypothetical protein
VYGPSASPDAIGMCLHALLALRPSLSGACRLKSASAYQEKASLIYGQPKKEGFARDGLERGGRPPKVGHFTPSGGTSIEGTGEYERNQRRKPHLLIYVSLSRVFLLLTKKKIIEQSNGEPTRIQDCGKEYGQHTKLCSENPGSCFGKRKRG